MNKTAKIIALVATFIIIALATLATFGVVSAIKAVLGVYIAATIVYIAGMFAITWVILLIFYRLLGGVIK